MALYRPEGLRLFTSTLANGWPPQLPAKEGKMRIWGYLPRWAILVLIGLSGCVLVGISEYFRWDWDYGVIRGIGEAAIVASLLGFTIDRWFRQDFARDVFYAAFGAMFREEFREELRWITSFEWLATKSLCHIKIDDLGNEIVRVTLTTNREIENISGSDKSFKGYIGGDDWGIPGKSAQIESIGIQKGGDQSIYGTEDKIEHFHISSSTKEIIVHSGETVKAFSKMVEYKRANDIHVIAFLTPSRNPELEIELPPTLEGYGSFSHRGKMEIEPFTGKKILKGTFLPSQLIVLRWWPKGQSIQAGTRKGAYYAEQVRDE